jgi:hypothetical protein
MAQREDVILKQLQTNIAEHEGRKKEIKEYDEAGKASRIAQNVLLEAELGSELAEKLATGVEQIRDWKDEAAEKERQQGIKDDFSQSERDRLFGAGGFQFNEATGKFEMARIEKPANMIEAMRGRVTGFSTDTGEFVRTEIPGYQGGEGFPMFEQMRDNDIQELYRASTQGVWIDEDGRYTNATLGDTNRLSDEAIELIAGENIQDKIRKIQMNRTEPATGSAEDLLLPFPKPPKDDPEPAPEPEPEPTVDYNKELNDMVESYGGKPQESSRKSLAMSFIDSWKRLKYKNIKKHVATLRDDPTNGFATRYLKHHVPEVYEAFLKTLPTEEGAE